MAISVSGHRGAASGVPVLLQLHGLLRGSVVTDPVEGADVVRGFDQVTQRAEHLVVAK